MSVQFVCQRGVGGLFVFVFLIRAGTPMYNREGGPVVHEQGATICRTVAIMQHKMLCVWQKNNTRYSSDKNATHNIW